jgi:release factor glutamine methyltransferase
VWLQSIFRKISTFICKPILTKYLKKSRVYNFKPFSLIILPGVFHPGLFFSSKYLLNYLQQLNLTNKKVVEVGAGSGLISFSLALKVKEIVAIEKSNVAIKGLHINFQNNKQFIPDNTLKIVQSNLFEAIEPCVFDTIVVNPPYFPKTVKNDVELAWNCGENFEYFQDFFHQASCFMSTHSIIIMVLSNQCDVEKIKQIAYSNQLEMELKHTKNFLIEDNFIFEFRKF